MKFTLLCILIYVHVCLARYTKYNNFLRIVGGRNATEDEFPYMVKLMLQLQDKSKTEINVFICSAAVLSPKWTLTAAHCITGAEDLKINKLAQIKLVIEYQPAPKSDFAYSDVITAVVHPGAMVSKLPGRNDIGLLHTQPVLVGKYARLSSIDFTTLKGQEVSIAGYGIFKKSKTPNSPQVLEVIVKECPENVHHPQMCFAPPCSSAYEIKAVCPGDSGGPVVHLSGIVSVNTAVHTRNCGINPGAAYRRHRHHAGPFMGSGTPVSLYVDWISSVMTSEIP